MVRLVLTWTMWCALSAALAGPDDTRGAGQLVALIGERWSDVVDVLESGARPRVFAAEAARASITALEDEVTLVARTAHHALAVEIARDLGTRCAGVLLIGSHDEIVLDAPVVTLANDTPPRIRDALAAHDLDVVTLAHDLDVRPLWRPGPRMWLHRSSVVMNGSPVWGNGALVVGEGGAVLLDTPWTGEQTTLLDAWARHSLGAPIRAAFVSHAHADAAGGTASLTARGIPVHGSADTKRFAAEIDVEVPSHTFAREAVLEVAGLAIDLYAPGDGHAPGNAVAAVRHSDVVFGGCLVKSVRARGMGFVGHADLDSWPRALDAVAARFPAARLLIPGHGSPGEPKALLTHTRTMVTTFREGTRGG